MRKTIKISGITFLTAFVAFFIYSLVPRVSYRPSEYGTDLLKSQLMDEETKESLATYIRDTANNAQAVVIIHQEKIALEVGDTKKLINAHSVRKSIMSLLIGIALNQGYLKLDETLEELGIDESKTPLTAQEKTATIGDLLMARSGIYLPAEAETDYAKKNRPRREQYKPGEFYFYNNFDFNVLGFILEKKTGQSIGEFMEAHLAKPLGFQDFSTSNIVYNSPWPVPNKTQSDYPVYWIFISARDLAKIGAMVAQQGKWINRQIVSRNWIRDSAQPHSKFSRSIGPYDAYGYSWWVDEDEQTIWFDGFGGQFLLIDPKRNLSISQMNFTGNSLLSSGLFFMKENRDGWRTDVLHLHTAVKEKFDQLGK
ncbi:serine hydrolase domain-containing protein [Tunicatimonas pelagia]|uniref:serine hydrolase domain-containing protein n=1 Tax=Tunicatimonas pelagia TaxID=931531 RepID=UPI002666B2C0|nr:serine hydrolase [Tunicatimonas pelagia]WKN41865.1 serine hydrolase [Tunicatimonas pelagia]